MSQQQQFAARIECSQDGFRPLRRRELWRATVVSVGEERMVVDLGVKRDGIVPRRDLRALGKEYRNSLRPGDRVPVSIVDASEFRDEIIPDPWPTVTERLCKGQVVEGTITRIAAPGIFVDIGRGVEGLLRVSEMSEDGETRNHLTPGSRVQVRVLGLDRERRRIRLGVEQAARGRFLTGVVSLWRKVLGLIGRGHSTG